MYDSRVFFFVQVSRRYLRSSVSKVQLMGPSMSVCDTFYVGTERPPWPEVSVGARFCSNYFGLR